MPGLKVAKRTGGRWTMVSRIPNQLIRSSNPLILLAIVLWLSAWARVLHTHLTVPSPARYTEFYTADGPIDPPSWPHCHSVRLIIEAQVWQYCGETNADPAGFIRFDLAAGRADLRWPVKDVPMGVLLGAVRAPDGGLIVAARNDVPRTTLWHLHSGGGFQALGELPYNMLALRVEGDHFEAITAQLPKQPMHHRRPVADGEWVTTALPVLPRLQEIQPDTYRFAAVDAASHSAAGWTLWGLRQGADATTAELWRCPPGGTWALESLTKQGFSDDRRRSTRLDRSIDGAIAPYSLDDELRVLARHESNLWVPLEVRPPGLTHPFLGNHSDLLLTAETTERLGLWRGIDGEFTKVGARWLGLVAKNGRIHPIDGNTPDRLGAALTREGWLASGATSGATFIPRPGGFTVLGTFGTYVNLDENLNRTDHLGLFARIAAHFGHFRRFALYNNTWYDLAPLKMVTLPILLLGLPMFLVPGLIRRRRASPAAAALWLVFAVIFAWHFWNFTSARWF